MAAMFPSAAIDGAPIEVAAHRNTRPDLLVRRLKSCLAAGCLLMVGLMPLGVVAQVTEPLLPYAAPSSLPQLPAPPGEQPTYPSQTVNDRLRPEFAPIGLRFGDFFWFPRAELDESYNSNIFATSTGQTYDLITALQPSFDLLSIFPRNAVNLHGSAIVQDLADHPAQNTQDGIITADGRLDVTAGSSIYGKAQFAHQHLSYGSPNTPGNIAQPPTYNDYRAEIGYMQGGRRFSFQGDIAVEAAQYNSVPLVGGGILAQSSNDLTITEAALRGSYELVPDYLGYIRVAGDLYDYWHTIPGTASTPGSPRFNSTVYRADLGLQILPRHIIYGEIYVGYLVQNFALSSLGSTTGPDAGGRLIWNVTRLTTLTFSGVRTFIPSNPTIGITGSGYLESLFTVAADHELLRNLLINVNASYENDQFSNTVPSRTDNVYGAGVGVRYLINRHLFLGGNYNYYQRSSSVSGGSYTQNVLMLRLGTQF